MNKFTNIDCPFCNVQFDLTQFPKEKSREFKSIVLSKRNDIALVQDIAPILPSHLLIIPRKHYFSFASVPESIVASQLQSLKSEISEFYGSEYLSVPLYFEHGSCNTTESTSSCIEHAHLHAIPVTAKDYLNILKYIKDKLGEPVLNANTLKKGYLYLEFENQKYYWEDRHEYKQFFRRLISYHFFEEGRSLWQSCLYGEEVEKSIKWQEELFSKWHLKNMN